MLPSSILSHSHPYRVWYWYISNHEIHMPKLNSRVHLKVLKVTLRSLSHWFIIKVLILSLTMKWLYWKYLNTYWTWAWHCLSDASGRSYALPASCLYLLGPRWKQSFYAGGKVCDKIVVKTLKCSTIRHCSSSYPHRNLSCNTEVC